MDSPVPDPQQQQHQHHHQQPPQPVHCRPQQPLEQSHPEAQGSYRCYYAQSAASSDDQNHYSFTSSQAFGAANPQPPHLAANSIIVPSQIPGQFPVYNVPAGLKPAAAAAVAAMSELSEFAGRMAQQEAVNGGVTETGLGLLHYPHLQAPLNILASETNGRGLTRRWRGRGRGRGRGRLGRGQGIGSSSSETEISSVKTLTTDRAPSKKPIPQILWCEICRVDCHSLDILEQHKNGKRHKKTVKKLEEMQAWQKLQLENGTKHTGNDTSTQPPQNLAEQITDSEIIIAGDEEKEIVQGGGENLQEATGSVIEEEKNVQHDRNNLQEATTLAVEEKHVQNSQQSVQEAKLTNGTDLENLQQNQSTELQFGEKEKSSSVQPTNASFFASRGGKRKMTGFGQGEKRVKHIESVGNKLPERPREQPVVCMICQIMCDTQTVFQTHLVGRKHIYRVGRFQRQQAISEPLGYFHENSQYVHTSQGPPPIFYGFQSPKVSQQYADLRDSREQPVVCTLCQIKCDTQTVFQTHLVGRKHISRVGTFQRQKATSGSLGYFHENPQYVHTSQGPAPIFYGFQPLDADMHTAPVEDPTVEVQCEQTAEGKVAESEIPEVPTGEVECEQTVEAVVEAAVSVIPEGLVTPDSLDVAPDSEVEKLKPEEQNTLEDDNIKPNGAGLDAPTEGSPASKPQ